MNQEEDEWSSLAKDVQSVYSSVTFLELTGKSISIIARVGIYGLIIAQ